MKANHFILSDEKNGYPFFSYSSFYAWIIYKNNPTKKYVRYSIETNQTLQMLLSEKYTENLELNLQNGYLMLQDFINKRIDKIKVARIYSTLPEYKNKYFFEAKENKIIHDNPPPIIFTDPIKVVGYFKKINISNKRDKFLILNNITYQNKTTEIIYENSHV